MWDTIYQNISKELFKKKSDNEASERKIIQSLGKKSSDMAEHKFMLVFWDSGMLKMEKFAN